MRSCLNTLQLLAARHARITAAHVHDAAMGQKDMTAAPFDVWNALLLPRKARPADMYSYLMAFGEHSMVRGLLRGCMRVAALALCERVACPSMSAYLAFLGGLVQNRLERQDALSTPVQIMGGVHENMLDLPYMDHSMERTVAACEWLQHFDVWSRRCMSRMQFELMPLLPTAALAVSYICGSAPSAQLSARSPTVCCTIACTVDRLSCVL